MGNNFYKLWEILDLAGWCILYSIEEKQRKDSVVVYYLSPYTSEDAAGLEAMLQALVSTFGIYGTYIYEVNDVYDIWRLNGKPILSITLSAK